MTTEDLARRFDRYRREGKAWRARCPVHMSKSLTLAIYSGADRSFVHCFAGCEPDDILASVGLDWKATYYQPRQKLDAKEWREQQRKREAEEKRSSERRIGRWILRFIEWGYTQEDRENDVAALCACAIVLTNQEKARFEGFPIPAWEKILQIHLERIAAAEHCMERRMLPPVARPRKDFP